MLIQNTQSPKLSFLITIAFLIIGLALFGTISTQAEPHQKSIGPEGGRLDAGYNSYLIIPEGALTTKIKIQAESSDDAIATDSEAIVEVLNNALALLGAQYSYTDQLPKEDDGSGEWAKNGTKLNIRWQSAVVSDKTGNALDAHNAGNGRMALRRTLEGLNALDELDARIKALMDDNYTKMGSVACAKIQAYSDQVRPLLETVDLLYDSTLVFEFAPSGTQFLIPAELVIPFEEIFISDELFCYSEGDIIEPIEIDYFIDEKEETFHFLIPHFSEYYYQRR
ncbi:hypothetical protein FJZ31_42625 [Candidatus Poribacteria bacterium]|nr:hypothetical protein [Candidatus Poribacteria bacterium]